MAFLDLEDLTGVVEVLIFPKLYQKFKDLVEMEKILIISAKSRIRTACRNSWPMTSKNLRP